MPTSCLATFQKYLALGPMRSLALLSEKAPRHGLATLKRWSSRYGWVELAKTHDNEVLKCLQDLSIYMKVGGCQHEQHLSIARRRLLERVRTLSIEPQHAPALKRQKLSANLKLLLQITKLQSHLASIDYEG
jgi:hypothetical protein